MATGGKGVLGAAGLVGREPGRDVPVRSCAWPWFPWCGVGEGTGHTADSRGEKGCQQTFRSLFCATGLAGSLAGETRSRCHCRGAGGAVVAVPSE